MQSTTAIFRRIGYAITFLIVAGVAAYVSYNHIRSVAVLGHQPGLVAGLLPLAVDGSMLICTLALAEDKAANRHPRGWARFGFWFGAAVSVTANIAATAVEHPDPLSIGVAALAPVLLLISVEVVSRPGKPKSEKVSSEPAISVQVQPPVQPAPAVATPVVPAATMQVTAISPVAVPAPAVPPQAPVSPAPTGGRKRIPTQVLANGQVVRADGGRVSDRTAGRRRRETKAAE